MKAPDMDTIELLAKLVSFDTTSHRPNTALIDWAEDYLRPLGFTCTRVPSACGSKANLVASIGPADRPGIILSGHTDVVPVDDQDWKSDPFMLRLDETQLVGRGAVDMKGFLAACLNAAPKMAVASLNMPFHLAFSYDEEIGCVGAKQLTSWWQHNLGPQAACFVGEPTQMEIVTGHKGNVAVRVRVKGSPAHSSLAPKAVNAIEVATDIISRIRQMAVDLERNGPRDELFDIPFCTSCIGRIEGGIACNVVPEDCWFDAEFRYLPAVDSGAIVAELKRYADDLVPMLRLKSHAAGIQVEELLSYPGLDTSDDSPAVTLARRCTQRNGSSKVAFGTEAGLFAEVTRTPTIIIGPGNIEQAHKPNEFIEVSQLAQCDRFLDRLITEACI